MWPKENSNKLLQLILIIQLVVLETSTAVRPLLSRRENLWHQVKRAIKFIEQILLDNLQETVSPTYIIHTVLCSYSLKGPLAWHRSSRACSSDHLQHLIQ